MGCHTWGYKKFSACTKDEQKKFLDKCSSSLKYLLRPYEETLKNAKRCAREYMKVCKKDSQDYKEWEEWGREENIKARYQENIDKFSRFKDGLRPENIKDFCEVYEEDADFVIVGEDLYIGHSFDEPFRVYGYPEETFTRKEDLLRWLKTYPPEKISHYDPESGFVKGYSDDLEKRINEYYEKEGEDNLYFSFGLRWERTFVE